ncbi:MAG: DUF6095 family protein [Schleiferiaceae bacterium]|nr:DUF6095 family protein [Schleiferiaceae bacterium]MDR9442373.1 DUF6095 family protein [Schleiferiaceae bacterium]
MASDKTQIIKGMRFLAAALPLIFTAPGLYVYLGVPTMEQGRYLWLGICLILMLAAVFLGVMGLRAILRGFFNDPS